MFDHQLTMCYRKQTQQASMAEYPLHELMVLMSETKCTALGACLLPTHLASIASRGFSICCLKTYTTFDILTATLPFSGKHTLVLPTEHGRWTEVKSLWHFSLGGDC